MLSLLAFPASTTDVLVKQSESFIFQAEKDQEHEGEMQGERERERTGEKAGTLPADFLVGKWSIIRQTQGNFKTMKEQEGIQLWLCYRPFQPNNSNSRMLFNSNKHPSTCLNFSTFSIHTLPSPTLSRTQKLNLSIYMVLSSLLINLPLMVYWLKKAILELRDVQS